MTAGTRVKLVAVRPSIYASPVGAIADVLDTRGETLRLKWVFASRAECDGWYEGRDFETA